VFPIGDEQNGRVLTPFVNLTLIGINILVFLYQLTLPQRALFEFIHRWAAIPIEVSQGQAWLGLLTSQFLHGGWAHIIGNMLFLWVFGDNVEDTMGHARYLIFYLLCGLAAGVAQVVVNPDSQVPLVGASGAIAGVLGAYILLFPHGRIKTLVFFFIVLVPAWLQIGYWIVFQFFYGFASLGVRTDEGGGVAYWAHVGGFLAGALLVWLFKDQNAVDRQRAARAANRAWQRVGVGQR